MSNFARAQALSCRLGALSLVVLALLASAGCGSGGDAQPKRSAIPGKAATPGVTLTDDQMKSVLPNEPDFSAGWKDVGQNDNWRLLPPFCLPIADVTYVSRAKSDFFNHTAVDATPLVPRPAVQAFPLTMTVRLYRLDAKAADQLMKLWSDSLGACLGRSSLDGLRYTSVAMPGLAGDVVAVRKAFAEGEDEFVIIRRSDYIIQIAEYAGGIPLDTDAVESIAKLTESRLSALLR